MFSFVVTAGGVTIAVDILSLSAMIFITLVFSCTDLLSVISTYIATQIGKPTVDIKVDISVIGIF
jgi:hypothetical protein